MKMTEKEVNGDVHTRMAYIPAQIHPHLDVVQHRSDGSIFLGASSLTGRTWSGSLWYFDEVANAPDVEKCTAGVELDTGLNDFALVSDNQVFLGLDTGVLQLWELKDDGASLSCQSHFQAHDSFITSVSVFGGDPQKAVSGSQDRSIKLIDLEEMATVRTCTAHYRGITNVACHPSEPEIFLSCGMDGRLLLWDMRKPKPATILDTSFLDSKPCSVAWHPDQQHTFAVGEESGAVTLIDHSGSSAPKTVKSHTRIVHRLKFSDKKSNWLASASDDSQAVVTDLSSGSVVWQSDGHKDFVRGLSWDPTKEDTLLTCGWDFKVLSHSVKPQPVSIDTKVTEVEAMDTISPNSG